jgi:D-amino-acid oxidase
MVGHSNLVATSAAADVTVLGGGVIGLATAIAVAETGLSVVVIAAAVGSDTTSSGAGALWRYESARLLISTSRF